MRTKALLGWRSAGMKSLGDKTLIHNLMTRFSHTSGSWTRSRPCAITGPLLTPTEKYGIWHQTCWHMATSGP
jgi:hypothetical protein